MRTPARSLSNAGHFRLRPTTPKLVGRFPDETRQPAQSGSLSKLIVRPGSVRTMVTNDYRALPKGVYVRFLEKICSSLPHREQFLSDDGFGHGGTLSAAPQFAILRFAVRCAVERPLCQARNSSPLPSL